MEYVVVPIEMIQEPNHYSEIEDGFWTLRNNNAQTLWFRFDISDALGQRPYITSAGDTLKAEFLRADQFSVQDNFSRLQADSRSIEKTCVASSDNRSLYKIVLISENVAGIVSGSVRFTYTSGGIPNQWMFNYAIKRELTSPGF